jgi:hypothetical protein
LDGASLTLTLTHFSSRPSSLCCVWRVRRRARWCAACACADGDSGGGGQR